MLCDCRKNLSINMYTTEHLAAILSIMNDDSNTVSRYAVAMPIQPGEIQQPDSITSL